jgi:Trk K+ transport system NAD-binding subunit
MNSKASRFWVRAGLALRQNRGALLFIALWLLANAVVFSRWFGMSRAGAALVALCVSKASGGWPSIYQSFTEVVVFGVIASVVVTNVTRKYRPEQTCRALAQRSSGHVVVIGWTNLGRRVADLVTDAGRSVVVVEENASLVTALVNEEHPLVIGSAQERGVLEDAAVQSAKVVVIATDDLETAAVASRLVREVNATCELIVRCPDDDVGAVLAKTYRARSVSTSRLAASFIQGQAVKARARAVVVLGRNNVGARVIEALAEKRIPYSFADVTEDLEKLTAAGVAEADMVIVCDDDLGKNLVRVDRIRDLNKRTRIICRAFHDEAAEILGRPPFECVVLSTSKYACESLARSGAFREVGITDVPERTSRAALATA